MDVLARVTEFLKERKAVAYLVGGAVRDQLLNRGVIRDLDISVVESAAPLARAFANAVRGAFYLMDSEHDVARVILGETYVDFARLRGDLVADLATRDFTINAMARPLDPEAVAAAGGPGALKQGVADPLDGLGDLAARRIRTVSDSAFRDDPVRLLRAIRFSDELGFAIETHSEALVLRDAQLLASASMERARDELFKILALPDPAQWLRRMDALGLVASLLPELEALRGVTQSAPHEYDALEHSYQTVASAEALQASDYSDLADGRFLPELQSHFAQVVSSGRPRGTLLRFIALLHDIGKAVTRSVDENGRVHFYRHEARGAEMIEYVSRRLHLSNDEMLLAEQVVRNHLRPAQLARSGHLSDRAIYHFYRDTGDAGIDICALSLADLHGKSVAARAGEEDLALRSTTRLLLERFYQAHDTVIAPRPLVTGRVLMRELGLNPGPQIGRILEDIREAQAEGRVSSIEDALAVAREIVSQDRRRSSSKMARPAESERKP